MGYFDTKRYNDAYERVLAKSTVLCKITRLQDNEPGEAAEGKAPRGCLFIGLATEEAAKTVDGEDLAPGFPKDIAFNYYPDTGGEPDLETANRITNERIRELVVHSLGLPPTIKDAAAELDKQGGHASLVGRRVGVEFSVGKTGRQNINRFLSPSLWEKKGA